MQNTKEELETIDLSFAEPSDEPIEMKQPADKQQSGKKRALTILAAIAILLTLVFGLRYYFFAMSHESTDDAFIEGHVVPISPKVAGHIAKLYVDDNQMVRKGDLLMEIDARDYQARLDQSKAELSAALSKQKAAEVNVTLTQVTSGAGITQASSDLQSAQSSVQTAQAQVSAKREKLSAAHAQVLTAQATEEQVRSEVKAAQAEAARAADDVVRYQQLFDRDEISRQQLDHAIATEKEASAQLEGTHKKVVASNARIEEMRAAEKEAAESLRQAESQTAEAQAHVGAAIGRLNQANAAPQQVAVSKLQAEMATAEIEQLQAKVKQAELDLSYTKIYAPETGRITRKNIEEGAYAQVGQAMFAIVPSNVWVIANFKETQLTHMRPGQPVEIKVDAYPGIAFKGHIESFQEGAGARFSLLPPENASGNYVKVVQRVPVKILFDEMPDENHLIAPGMSVEPEVEIN